jgi:3-deoxy-D-arabino-heptulosonate 7-phosphate (DAHP) synthase class II
MKKDLRQNNEKIKDKTPVKVDDSHARTREVLADMEIMNQITQSKKKNVKARDFEEVADELDL